MSGSSPSSSFFAQAERLADLVQGSAEARHRGQRVERIWRYRSYQGGEPAQTIDWRQSARGEKIFVRESEMPAFRDIFLWTGGETVHARAMLWLAALARLLVRAERTVGWLGPDLRKTKTLSRVDGLFPIGQQPSFDRVFPPDPPQLARSLVVLVEEFSGKEERHVSALQSMAARGNHGILMDLGAALPSFRADVQKAGWVYLSLEPAESDERAVIRLWEAVLSFR